MTTTTAPSSAEHMPERPSPPYDDEDLHAYARAYAAQEVARERDRLLSVALQYVPHAYEGDCPDELDRTRRDPNCPACKLLGNRNA